MPISRRSHPDKLICTPFPTNAAETKVNNAFAQTQQKVETTGLKVIYGNAKVAAGATVFVAGEDCRSLWGKKVLHEPGTGTPFVVVPIDAVLYVFEDVRQNLI